MSRARSVQALRVVLLAAVLVAGAAGCSSDGDSSTTTERGKLSFGEPPEDATRLGLCKAYDDAQVKEVLGAEGFAKLAPSAIGEEGDAVTGERCSWKRTAGGDALTSVTIEATDWGADLAGLEAKFTELRDQALEPTDVAGIGDAAFTQVSDETSQLQARTGQYLITISTRGTGEGMAPVELPVLQFWANQAVGQLS